MLETTRKIRSLVIAENIIETKESDNFSNENCVISNLVSTKSSYSIIESDTEKIDKLSETDNNLIKDRAKTSEPDKILFISAESSNLSLDKFYKNENQIEFDKKLEIESNKDSNDILSDHDGSENEPDGECLRQNKNSFVFGDSDENESDDEMTPADQAAIDDHSIKNDNFNYRKLHNQIALADDANLIESFRFSMPALRRKNQEPEKKRRRIDS